MRAKDYRGVERRTGAVERRGPLRRVYMLVCESDTTATKLTLSIGAWLTAAGFWLDAACPYVACEFMESSAPWPVWAALWTLYGAAEPWRALEGVHRPRIALVVNSLGAFLWGGVAVGSTLARWPHFELSSAIIALACAAVWVLARTAVNPGYGFRGD